ncbi:protein arginine N-methyltransferase 1.6 isoform X1 [Beta vulgaris subsp. vulgaris]|uniref:protein arginine N-methyltransferase 1.6 isoform X1 n=2 Tax=Beta vulgaris subsp. vulgaris TaxID=3555 RepID=UPI002036721F|nr:protein arginine N-methyltransferase 1.6 isoform X1 [Beta vulgaris subsp. vulgaris]
MSQSYGSSSQMFQLKLDPLTGNSEWVVVGADDDGAGMEVELATTSYLDMLNDSCRNKAYREAIDKTVTRPCCVLDIGAGTGLLSMIAARAMPTNSDSKGSVFACESYLPMFKLMRKLVRCNSLDKNIKIINKRSDELIIGVDIPARADILVSEILDSELLGEGLIPTLQHAHDELLVQNPLTVPYRAIVYGQLLESSFLWKLHDLYNNDISASDAIRLLPPQLPYMLSVKPKQYPMHCDPLQHESKLLSEPFKIFEFDFSKRPDSYGEADIFINSTADGTVNAVISWWVLQLDQQGTIYYSTAPKWIKHLQPGSETWCDHWKQCVWFVPGKGLSVSRDEEIHLHAVHSDISISYSLRVASQRTKNENSIRNDGFQLILPPEKIATYSDDSWRHSVLLAVQNAFCRKDYPLCFVADDSIFLATAIAHLCKTSRIMLLFPGLRERGFQYLQAIAETNQFSVNCMKLLDHRIDCMTMYDTDGKKIDVLVGEPFYLGSENYLPWRNLRFWKERTRLERILSKDVQVIPSRGILRVSAMFLPDLWRSRCSLVNIEGFNHSGANTILGACGNLPSPQDSPILPFFVWQSGETKELSERLTLMEFDFSKPMTSCAGKAKVDFTETGICHGFVLWIDWVLDEEDGIVVSTGPDHRHWKQGVKLLRTPVGVGSRDNKRSDERHSVEMKASFDSTNGNLAIQYDFV